jgi:secernin
MVPPPPRGSQLKLKHIFYHVYRLGLERGQTAAEAMKVITNLLEEHGQGGRCFENDSVKGVLYHNSFIIADPTEAWVLETAERHWAAEKVACKCLSLLYQ